MPLQPPNPPSFLLLLPALPLLAFTVQGRPSYGAKLGRLLATHTGPLLAGWVLQADCLSSWYFRWAVDELPPALEGAVSSASLRIC